MLRANVTRLCVIIFVLAAPLAVNGFQQNKGRSPRDTAEASGVTADTCSAGAAAEAKRNLDCTLKQFLFREIGLSSEQASKMRTVTTRSMQQIKKCRSATKRINEEKVNMFLCGRVDKDRLEMLDREYLRYHTQLVSERLKMQRERVILLNEDQVKLLGGFLATKSAQAVTRKASR